MQIMKTFEQISSAILIRSQWSMEMFGPDEKIHLCPYTRAQVVRVSSVCRVLGSKAFAVQVVLHRNNVFCNISFSYTLFYTPLPW